eukprot:scaffold3437_cov113-Cylindrotheca_fusiformis.AAC.41
MDNDTVVKFSSLWRDVRLHLFEGREGGHGHELPYLSHAVQRLNIPPEYYVEGYVFFILKTRHLHLSLPDLRSINGRIASNAALPKDPRFTWHQLFQQYISNLEGHPAASLELANGETTTTDETTLAPSARANISTSSNVCNNLLADEYKICFLRRDDNILAYTRIYRLGYFVLFVAASPSSCTPDDV